MKVTFKKVISINSCNNDPLKKNFTALQIMQNKTFKLIITTIKGKVK